MAATTYILTRRTDCPECHGTGNGVSGPMRDECHVCGGDGRLSKITTLTAALSDLGVLDRLTALESAVRHLEKAK